MKTVYTSLGLVAGASAAALVPRDSCCFGLTASGGVSGSVGQLSDGQNRIAQTGGLANQNGQYCINSGQITDGNGRGCILTPPTTQFQCDSGASPTGGFSVSNGNLAYNGNTQFYACPTGDNGGYNIYTQAVANQQGCVTVTLSTGGQCSGSGSGSSSAAGSASSAPAASSPASFAAQSSPAASASASSAPASSAPASSAPAASSSGAGASSVASSVASQASSAASMVSSMASSAVSSSPAASAPASGPATQTVWSTQYQTVTSCGPSVTNCPADSTVVYSSVVPMTSAPAGSAPASSAPAASATASSAPASSAPAASAPASSAPASSAAQSSAAASGTAPSSASGSACQTALTGAYQTPHAIIPVNQNSPDQSYGTQYNAYIGGGNSTIFNFDIPSSYSGKQCSVIFLFPQQSQLETSSFTQSGSGGLTFEQLSSAAGLDVTYNSAPKGQTQLDQISSVTPGNSYLVSTGSCQAGTTESIEVSSTGDFSLEFFEDWNPSPIGLFITSC